jgi:L-threonylcarbamoyladenylate synthase
LNKSILDHPRLRSWLTALQAGEVVVAPAEGVYGYCCDPFSEAALFKLMDLKQRSPQKGLIVLVQRERQLREVCAPLGHAEREAIATYWAKGQPPTTLVLPAKYALSPLLTGGRDTLAIRRPRVGYMREYLAAWGRPLVSTSLNKSGEAPATEASAIPARVVALTLPVPLSGIPSRIYDCAERRWVR